jgi:hypothetical protein
VGVTVGPVGVRVGVRVAEGVRVGVGVAAVTASVAVAAICCLIAEIVTLDAGAEPGVVMENEADVEPATTVTLAGTVAAEVLELERQTGTPPAGAAAEIVTVPVALLPPTTAVGASVRLVGRGAVAVSVALAEEVPRAAVTVVPTSLPTTAVVAVNVADEAAASTVTEAGIVTAAVFDEASVTTAPPTGAGPLRVTVPVDD